MAGRRSHGAFPVTGVPVQGAGTDDELREVYAATLFAAKQAYDGDFYVAAWEDNYARDEWYALADALLSDPGVLAAMQRREEKAAAKAEKPAMVQAFERQQLYGQAYEQGHFDARMDITLGRTDCPCQNPAPIAVVDQLDPNGRPDQ